MKVVICIITILFTSSCCFAQKRPNEIQLIPIIRYDWYPEITFNYGGRFSTDQLKMKGLSFGLNANYKYTLRKKINITAGLGFYKYSFSNLKRINSSSPSSGISKARPSEIPSNNNFFYSTYSYYYTTLSFNIGIEKLVEINKNINFFYGIGFSQYLKLKSVYKTNFGGFVYKKKDLQLFAQTILANIGFEKKFRKINIGPHLLVPIFDSWHKDEVFLEPRNEKRNKWLKGIGLGISCNYKLSKK